MSSETSPQVVRRLELAISAAREAGGKTLELFRREAVRVERKEDGSPVTRADREAEELLRARIAAQFPNDGVLGEEFGEAAGSSGFRWVLDPIDGTKSFITGVPLYTTLVAVLDGEEPLIGVIYAPATGEMVYAVRGGSTSYSVGSAEAVPAKVSPTERLADATFLTSEVASFAEDKTPSAKAVYDHFEQQCRLTRTWGDGYGYLLVATGRADIMIDPEVNLWDVAPHQPVIEGAGGRFCDWKGAATVHSGDSLATNAALADQVVALTRDYLNY